MSKFYGIFRKGLITFNLKLAPTKILFGVEVLMRPGQRITAESNAPGCGEIKALLKIPMEILLRSLMGAVSYYRKTTAETKPDEFATDEGCSS